MTTTARKTDTTTPDRNHLEEAICRKLCQIMEVDPDEKYYPVHPSHHNIYFPIWQRLRTPAQEIIAMVHEAEG